MDKKKRILIIKNEHTEGPGAIEDILIEKELDYKIVDLDIGEKLPDNFDFDGIVVLGGSDSANDDTVKIKKEIEFIKRCLDRQIPYLGICLGMQLLVKALGGEVIKSPLKEIGFRGPDGEFFEVMLTEKGRKSSLFKGIEERYKVFQLHQETVVLNNKIDLLAIGKFVKNQAISYKDFAFGLQHHFEMTENFIRMLITIDKDLKNMESEKIIEDFHFIKSEYLLNGKILFTNFINNI